MLLHGKQLADLYGRARWDCSQRFPFAYGSIFFNSESVEEYILLIDPSGIDTELNIESSIIESVPNYRKEINEICILHCFVH